MHWRGHIQIPGTHIFRRISLRRLSYPILTYLVWRAAVLSYMLVFRPCPGGCTGSRGITGYLTAASGVFTSAYDANVFRYIARTGYKFPLQAFFPLWPLLMRTATAAGIPADIAVHILLTILGAAVFCLLYLLADDLYGARHARLSLLWFAVFPPTMILLAGYSESLYLALILLGAYLVRRQRALGAAIAMALAAATRITGFTGTLLLFDLKQPPVKRAALMVVGVTGILSYILYLQFTFSDGMLFLRAHQAWCGQRATCGTPLLSDPVRTATHALKNVPVFKPLSGTNGLRIMDTASIVLLILFLIPIAASLPAGYYVYALANLLIPLMSGSITGMSRYALAVFPLFLVLPKFVRPVWQRTVLLSASFALQLYLVGFFLRGGFIG